MTESASRRVFSLLGAAWMALAAVHGILQALAPRSQLGDPLLTLPARLALLATEWTLIALLLAPAGGLFAAAARMPARLRPLSLGLRWLLGALLLVGLAASWTTFWLSGQFLDRQGFLYAASNLSSLRDYAATVHPFLVYGLPWLLLGASVAACEGFPRALAALPPGARSKGPWIAAAGVVLSFLAALAGDVSRRFGVDKVTDPASGAIYSRDELYRLRRDRNTGPLTHLAATCWGARDFLEVDPPSPPPELTRRPIEPMEKYLSRIDRATVNRWNVIVVLIDSLRADQLQATGGKREVMPALEALAREGRVFTDCVTPASHTDYACPAVFSSHYPLRTRDIYRYPADPIYPRVLIYDVLKPLGWRTALHSSQNEHWGQMLNYFQTGGLDSVFHAGMAGIPSGPEHDRPKNAGMLDDGITVSHSLEWIAQAPETPFFLYLNLQNSHLPYSVPGDFPRRFSPKELDFEIKIGWYPKEKTDIVKGVYADSLAYVDSQLDRLIRGLKERDVWDRTLIVVSGDHGEAFYEHGSAAHANGVHEEVIRVPLVIRAPGLEPGRDARPAHLMDVAPGVFHLLGLPVHPSFQGEDPFGPAPDARRVRYVVSDTPWKTQLGVIRSGFKLIRDGDTGGSVLYDLARDPGETTDASAARPEIARDLRTRLAAWRRAQLDYYDNAVRQRCEYPPVIRE